MAEGHLPEESMSAWAAAHRMATISIPGGGERAAAVGRMAAGGINSSKALNIFPGNKI